jgi:hypothetical protein
MLKRLASFGDLWFICELSAATSATAKTHAHLAPATLIADSLALRLAVSSSCMAAKTAPCGAWEFRNSLISKIMKIGQCGAGALALALVSAMGAQAQNVGIGFSGPESKLTVNGNFAVGTDYNTAAPTNGAIIEGFVGIGTTTPIAPLEVPGYATLNESGGVRTFFDYATIPQLTQQTITTTSNVTSAVFGQCVFSANAFISYGGTLTASDARLKNIIGRSDDAQDLQTLKMIEVTDYTLRDPVTFGNKPVKKLIAQQLELVYPTAVRTIGLKGVTFTPDIYAVSDSIKVEKPGVYLISLGKAHGLKDGDLIRLITQERSPELRLVVHVVNEKAFTVETKEPLGNKVFVYGKQCLDLRAIDYDAISVLNVSATQALAKKVETLEQQNSELQGQAKRLTAVEQQQGVAMTEQASEIATLKAENEKLAAMAAKIDVLEKALATMQDKGKGLQTAVLQQ